ncbi:MAG: SPOR domain-containing protein [Phycisphaerales bacterium]|nr:SPOR domain-containing protein [Phycisphaerales bacterium]
MRNRSHLPIGRARSAAALALACSLAFAGFGCQSGGGNSKSLAAARQAYDRGDFATSMQLLGHYLESADHSQNTEEAMYLRGLSAAKSGKRQQAYADLRRCADAARGSDVRWRASLALGVMYFEDNQWSDAGRAYFTAISTMPERPPMDFALWRLGQCYERTGRWSSATAPYTQLVRKFPASELTPRAKRRIELRPTFFAVRCGAFGNAQNAQRMAADLRQQGFGASVRTETTGGKPLHIVLVGKFDTYESAMQQVAAVRSAAPDAVIWP